MSSIQTEQIAVDTNEFIFAIRRTEARDSSFRLLYDHISALAIYVPLQVHLEIQRNLSPIEYVEFKKLIGMALNIEHGTGRPSPGSIARFEKRGAKKGDTLIAEELVDKGVRWLISENRHFLVEMTDLPFTVLSASQALDLLRQQKRDK